jgi:hypothetical protein
VDRRNFLGAGLMAGLALTGIAFTHASSAVASGSGPHPPGPTPTGPTPTGPTPTGPTPTGPGPAATQGPGLPTWPLFEWEQPGGFFHPGEGVLQPPPLAVYGDNTAYADAAKSLPIPPIWVSTLRDHALYVLGTPADLVRDPAEPLTGDRPIDHVRVRTTTGDYLTVRLPGWQDGDPQHTYPPQIRELYQHAIGIRRHVLAAGRPWNPTGVLLAVVTVDYRPDHFRAWPKRLPTPDGALYEEIRLPDGPDGLPRATDRVWPFYRVGRSRFVAATWRPLLPHEIT